MSSILRPSRLPLLLALAAVAGGCSLVAPFGSFQAADAAVGLDAPSEDASSPDARSALDDAGSDGGPPDAPLADAPLYFDLDVTVSGVGMVASTAFAAPCTDSCSTAHLAGTLVTLTASADASHTFAGWTGDCMGTDDCVVTMDMARAVTARFLVTPRRLAITVDGTEGSVRSDGGEIDCPGTCAADFDDGSMVMLEAVETDGYRFTGWTGACSGPGLDCTVTMTGDQAAGASFARRSHTVTVVLSGPGTGVVSGGGIDCSSVPGGATMCTTSVLHGDMLSLVAAPAGGVDFDGWTGPCSDTALGCTFAVTGPTMVGAEFGPRRFDVTVENTPATGGRVLGVVGGTSVLSCADASCTARVAEGASLQLTAVPGTGYRHGAWSRGGCTPASACTLTVVGNETVRASWVRQHTLTVRQTDGYPSGNTLEAWSPATNTPLAGVASCRDATGCAFVVDEGTTVRVSVTRTPRWQGVTTWGTPGCAGPTCDVTVSSDRTLDITTGPLGRLVFTTSMQFDGDLEGSSLPAADEADGICQRIATAQGMPGTYRAWLSGTDPGSDVATRFAGAQGPWVRADGTPFAASLADLFAARLLNFSGVDELGNRYPGASAPWRWSNTNTNGTAFSTTLASTCNGFSSPSSGTSFAPGVAGSGGSAGSTRWTSHTGFNGPCSNVASLGCFQIETTGPVMPLLPGPRLAANATPIFISAATFAGNAGVAAMDAACQSEAMAAGLPGSGVAGSYVAFVGVDGAAPASRTTRPVPWVRPDGWPAVTELTAGVFDTYAPAILRADGTRPSSSADVVMWTGSSADALGASTTHCAGWTTTTGSGTYGDATGSRDWAQNVVACTTVLPVYCVRR